MISITAGIARKTSTIDLSDRPAARSEARHSERRAPARGGTRRAHLIGHDDVARLEIAGQDLDVVAVVETARHRNRLECSAVVKPYARHIGGMPMGRRIGRGGAMF